MNNLVKEIYKQCYSVRLSVDDFALDYKEKLFAESIIRACINVANDNYDCGKFPVGDKIAKHFGIEL